MLTSPRMQSVSGGRLPPHFLPSSPGKAGGYVNSSFYDYAGGVPAGVDAYHPVPGVYLADTNGEFAGYSASIVGNKSIVRPATTAAATLVQPHASANTHAAACLAGEEREGGGAAPARCSCSLRRPALA